mmetsp:Transcript_71723/g.167959  ORF Transcript_71723/g.167959 Transcript_71723/m.167959 type:complete len:217 (-) Transcript_71723:123-773(-)
MRRNEHLVDQVINLQDEDERHPVSQDVHHVPGPCQPQTGRDAQCHGDESTHEGDEAQNDQPLVADANKHPATKLRKLDFRGAGARKTEDGMREAEDGVQLDENKAEPDDDGHAGEHHAHWQLIGTWKHRLQVGIDLAEKSVVPPLPFKGPSFAHLAHQRRTRGVVVGVDAVAVVDAPLPQVRQVVLVVVRQEVAGHEPAKQQLQEGGRKDAKSNHH